MFTNYAKSVKLPDSVSFAALLNIPRYLHQLRQMPSDPENQNAIRIRDIVVIVVQILKKTTQKLIAQTEP